MSTFNKTTLVLTLNGVVYNDIATDHDGQPAYAIHDHDQMVDDDDYDPHSGHVAYNNGHTPDGRHLQIVVYWANHIIWAVRKVRIELDGEEVDIHNYPVGGIQFII